MNFPSQMAFICIYTDCSMQLGGGMNAVTLQLQMHRVLTKHNATGFQRQAICQSTPDTTRLCDATKLIKFHSQSEACVGGASLQAHCTPNRINVYNRINKYY